MSQAVRQAWWGPLAGLLIVGQLVIATMFVIDADGIEESIVGAGIALGGAALLVAGLWQRPYGRMLGSILLVLGCIASAIWFWSFVMPLLAIVVAVGVVVSDVRAPSRSVEVS